MNTRNYLISMFLWKYMGTLSDKGYDFEEAYYLAQEVISDYMSSNDCESFDNTNDVYGDSEALEKFVSDNKYI